MTACGKQTDSSTWKCTMPPSPLFLLLSHPRTFEICTEPSAYHARSLPVTASCKAASQLAPDVSQDVSRPMRAVNAPATLPLPPRSLSFLSSSISNHPPSSSLPLSSTLTPFLSVSPFSRHGNTPLTSRGSRQTC